VRLGGHERFEDLIWILGGQRVLLIASSDSEDLQ
jgi:hypothetical protein